MKCDKCGRSVDSRREEIEHLLEQHDDTVTSHEKDELKRELNDLDDDEGRSFPLRTVAKAVLVLAVLVGGGYALASTGVIEFSADGSSGPGDVALGPAGSTHEHAQFSVVVNGESIDFSKPQYQYQQTQNPRIHFEGGDGSTIHKHATGVTIGFALESLNMGINATCLQVHADTYCENDTATLETTVNGNVIEDPASHVIRDGETVRISYES